MRLKLDDINQSYQVELGKRTAAETDLSGLQGQLQLAEEENSERAVVRHRARQKLQRLIEVPGVSVDEARRAYHDADQAVKDSEQRATDLRIQVRQAKRSLKTIQSTLEGLKKERESLERSLALKRFERLREQIEREQEVIVREQAGCGEETKLGQCRERALKRAQQRASEQGSAVLLSAVTEVKDFELTRDELRTHVNAIVLSYEVLDEGFVERSGYFYRLRALVKGRIPSALRDRMMGIPAPGPHPLKAKSPPINKPFNTAHSFEISYIYRSGGIGLPRPITDGSLLRSGDHYKIIFTPDRDAYVYIYQVDTAGQVVQLFPMQAFKGVEVHNANPVRKNQRYTLPAKDKAFELDRQVGRERLYFLAFPDRHETIEQLYGEVERARRQLETRKAEDAQAKLRRHFTRRGVAAIVSDHTMPIRWRGRDEVFTLFSQRLESLCENCVYVVEFKHQ